MQKNIVITNYENSMRSISLSIGKKLANIVNLTLYSTNRCLLRCFSLALSKTWTSSKSSDSFLPDITEPFLFNWNHNYVTCYHLIELLQCGSIEWKKISKLMHDRDGIECSVHAIVIRKNTEQSPLIWTI